MKIVYLLASSDISGGQRVIFQQAEELARQFHEVTLVCPEPTPMWFPIQRAKWEETSFSHSRALKRADICVATYWTTVAAAVASFDGPIFHLCQGYEADFSFNQPVKAEIESAYSLNTHKLTVSHHVENRLKSVGYDPVTYIGQTFDPDEFPPPLKKRVFENRLPIILLPGIFESEVKGISEVLEALARLHETGFPFYLRRVSTWPLSDAEKSIFLAQEYSMRLTPSQMRDAYQDADLLIGPSHPEEGFGLHVLEALSTALPALISDTPGHRHIAQNAAEYFRWGDSHDIRLKLQSLLNNPTRLQELSEIGPSKAHRFSTVTVAQKLIQLFKLSLNSNPNP